MSEEVWWYATRAAGLMTWSTAVAAVIVGLLLSTRVVKSRTGPWLLDLHRFLGGISVLFLLVHMGTLWADSFVDFGPRELLIPGESTWNTEAAAWGVIAAWTLVLVELTSLLRKWLSKLVWRTFHMLSIVTVIAGSYHAWLGGTDVDNPLTWLIAGAGSAIVVALVAVRLKRSEEPSSPRAAKALDREAVLAEMRDRLESLPVPENTAQPELKPTGGALPRRAPVTIDRPTEAPAPVIAPAHMPIEGPAPAATHAATFPPSTDDPFGDAPFDPFNQRTAEPSPPTAPAAAAPQAPSPAGWAQSGPAATGYDELAVPGHPATEPFARPDVVPPQPPAAPPASGSPFGAPPGETPAAPQPAPFFEPEPPAGSRPDSPFPASSPFDSSPPALQPNLDQRSPFGSESPPVAQPAPEPPMAPLATPGEAELFAPASPDEDQMAAREAQPFPELAEPAVNPFQPAETTTHSIAVDVPTNPPAPPPLPTAIDPATGEPDQAAYSAWLVEWLAFAEKYGEETPHDPSRAL